MLETIYRCLLFGIFSTLAVLLLMLWRAVYSQQFDFNLWSKQGRKRRAPTDFSPKAQQLIVLIYQRLQGNKGALVDLYLDQQRKHPERSDVWIMEKILHDLERDRR